MTRIRTHEAETDWNTLHKTATADHKTVRYARARCEHGFTREQICRDCENGYVQDTSEYAAIRTSAKPIIMIAVSDDGYDVAYVR